MEGAAGKILGWTPERTRYLCKDSTEIPFRRNIARYQLGESGPFGSEEIRMKDKKKQRRVYHVP